MSTHPFLSDEFHIRWSQLTPDRVEADINRAIEEAQTKLDAICAVAPGAETYQNTFQAFDLATELLNRGWGRLNHLDSVRNSPEQRAALNKMLPVVSAFSAGIPLNEVLWKALKAYVGSPDAETLDPIRARFLEETCAYFRDAGADLPPDQKKRMAEVQARLSELTQKFTEHVLDSTNAWELVVDEESRLAGLPGDAIASARADAHAKGHGDDEDPKWRFTLQFPSMFPVMQYAEDDSLRREIYEGNSTVGNSGNYDNSVLVWEILKLRREKAELLGFANFADLVLQRRQG